MLAGGRGSRMGRPKASVELAGHTLADRAVAMLRSVECDPVLVVEGGDEGPLAALLEPGQAAALGINVDRVIDARGKYVIPGGVDSHTHMELPFGGTFASDTFETGSRAAAWGGTTTIIDFAVQRFGENVQDGLADWHRKAEGNCAIDYGFHQIIGGVDDESLKAMRYLSDHEGITSFKLFMAYPGVFYSDDGQILRAMQVAAENGSMLMMHAENGTAIDVLISQALAPGQSDPRFHTDSRRPRWRKRPRSRIMLAKVAKLPALGVHMSDEGIGRNRRARSGHGCQRLR